MNHRALIARGGDRSIFLVRVYLMLFSIHRVMIARGKPDFKTVIAPQLPVVWSDDMKKVYFTFQGLTMSKFWAHHLRYPLPPLCMVYRHRLSWSAGPNSSVSPLGVLSDASICAASIEERCPDTFAVMSSIYASSHIQYPFSEDYVPSDDPGLLVFLTGLSQGKDQWITLLHY